MLYIWRTQLLNTEVYEANLKIILMLFSSEPLNVSRSLRIPYSDYLFK